MSSEIDKDYIISKIQELVNKVHQDPRRKKIRVFNDKIQYACEHCGDSQKDPNKKRANLYFKNMYKVCYNEGCNMSFTKLLKDNNIEIDLQKKLDIYNYIDKNLTYSKEDNVIIQKLDRLIDIDFLSDYLNSHPETKFSNFGPIKTNSAAYQYLKFDRLIENFENIYESDYNITPKWKEKVIVILNKSGKKVLGLQVRNLRSGDKRMFKVYNFEALHNTIHPDDPLEQIESASYNKISNFYNILNVNWDDPVTIFEGYLDSIFYPNSIGAIGVNSIDDMQFLMSEDLYIQFFFDQDLAGIKKSVSMLEKGYKVFLWQKLVEDLLKNKKDKYKAKHYLSKIKDLNKLAQEMKSNEPFNKLKLNKYFSNDIFDKIFLDYSNYTNNEKTSKYTKKLI
jgi:hypothetical protein